MRPTRATTATPRILTALAGGPAGWRHGYELLAETGLKSGTLYPILVRLAERGLLDTAWEQEPPPGRPLRHLYRLTPTGRAWLQDVPPARTARLGLRLEVAR